MVSSLLPIHILLRLVLESDSVTKAIDRLTSLQGSATSAHLLIADPMGSRGVEISPFGLKAIKEDEDGVVVHSNHFVLNHPVDEPQWLVDSPFRIERIRELCGEAIEESREGSTVDIDRVRMLFRDTMNPPGSICCQDTERGLVSLFNIVMHLSEGPPKAEVVFAIGTGEEGMALPLPW
jgi:isopenicillin-N N-acyltransferase like protein